MKGRKPRPTLLKIAMGNPRHENLKTAVAREPVAVCGIPEPPKFLDEAAMAEWNRITPILLASGLVSASDGVALGNYCQAFSRWGEAETKLREFGMVVMSPDKQFPIQSPYLAIANKAMEQCMRALVEFGMTPSSRTRIQVPNTAKETEDSLESFARKKSG